MLLVDSYFMREAENKVMERYGINEDLLMEIVATRVTDRIIEKIGKIKGKVFLVFSGKGKNGGDAIAIARHLILIGATVKVFVIKGKDDVLSPLTQEQLKRLKAFKPECILEFSRDELKGDFIIDGLFGTGFKGDVETPYKEVIGLINKSGIPVFSIDIPSGLDASTGKVSAQCVTSKYTFTLGLAKLGLFIYPGAEYAGNIEIINLGFPLEDFVDASLYLIDEDMVEGILPPRRPDTHKGTYGRLGIIAGSYKYPGASILATIGALASGVGLTTLLITDEMYPLLHSIEPEVTFYPREDWQSLLPSLTGLVIGPGLGKTEVSFLKSIIRESPIPMVIDADGLNNIADSPNILKEARVPVVVTPHPGEMARLTRIDISSIQANRIEVARNFSRTFGVITILKGARTVVSSSEGKIFINPTGNSKMATGGMGDVLSGLLGGLISRGVDPLNASLLGVYIHGLAGDILGRRRERVLGKEVASLIPKLLHHYSG
ncbi:MAG: NAD(P)H-hydrate dehydratase [bacterium]